MTPPDENHNPRPQPDATNGEFVHPPRDFALSILNWGWASFFIGNAVFWSTFVEFWAGLMRRPAGVWGHPVIAFFIRRMVMWHPFYEVQVEGADNLPKGSAVLCANHRGFFDVMALMFLPRTFSYIVKAELFQVPVLSWAMRRAGYLALRRGNQDDALKILDESLSVLARGTCVVIFPEGTRQRGYTLGTFTSGAARLAMESGRSLVPVSISGAEDILVRGSFQFPKRGKVMLHVGRPFDPNKYRTARRLTRELREELQNNVNTLDTRRVATGARTEH